MVTYREKIEIRDIIMNGVFFKRLSMSVLVTTINLNFKDSEHKSQVSLCINHMSWKYTCLIFIFQDFAHSKSFVGMSSNVICMHL